MPSTFRMHYLAEIHRGRCKEATELLALDSVFKEIACGMQPAIETRGMGDMKTKLLTLELASG